MSEFQSSSTQKENIVRHLYASHCVLLASSCNGWAGRAIMRIFSARPNQIKTVHAHYTFGQTSYGSARSQKVSKKVQDCLQIEYDFPLIRIVNDFQSSGAEALPHHMVPRSNPPLKSAGDFPQIVSNRITCVKPINIGFLNLFF